MVFDSFLVHLSMLSTLTSTLSVFCLIQVSLKKISIEPYEAFQNHSVFHKASFSMHHIFMSFPDGIFCKMH